MISLTPSHIIQYLYCPRFIYFEHVLAIPQFEEKSYKAMKGRELHDEKLERNKDYLRQRIGALEKYQEQYITNDQLRGKVDEVLLLKDGTMAPLDYKFAFFDEKVYSTYKTQLQCYAILIEDNFRKKVNKGYLVYVRSKNKLIEVPIKEEDKLHVKKCITDIAEIIEKNYFPKASSYKKRCLSCTYKNICIK